VARYRPVWLNWYGITLLKYIKRQQDSLISLSVILLQALYVGTGMIKHNSNAKTVAAKFPSQTERHEPSSAIVTPSSSLNLGAEHQGSND
jgi:hypothetical protein